MVINLVARFERLAPRVQRSPAVEGQFRIQCFEGFLSMAPLPVYVDPQKSSMFNADI